MQKKLDDYCPGPPISIIWHARLRKRRVPPCLGSSADPRTGFRPSADPGKKGEIFETATKVSFVTLNQPFFNRLDIFSNARLLKITLVLLIFGENHYLRPLGPSLGRGLTQSDFSFCPNRPNSGAKKRSVTQGPVEGGAGRRSAHESKHWSRRSPAQCFLFNVAWKHVCLHSREWHHPTLHFPLGNASASSVSTALSTRSGCHWLADRFLNQNLTDFDKKLKPRRRQWIAQRVQ